MTSRWRSRLKSLSPSSVSSAFTCWLTAPGVTNSSSAARVKLLLRAAASKALTALSEGRRRGIRPFIRKALDPGSLVPSAAQVPLVGRGAPRERPKRLNFPAIIDTRKVRSLTISGGAHQAADRGSDPAHAAAPGGAERPHPARVRRRDHV